MAGWVRRRRRWRRRSRPGSSRPSSAAPRPNSGPKASDVDSESRRRQTSATLNALSSLCFPGSSKSETSDVALERRTLIRNRFATLKTLSSLRYLWWSSPQKRTLLQERARFRVRPRRPGMRMSRAEVRLTASARARSRRHIRGSSGRTKTTPCRRYSWSARQPIPWDRPTGCRHRVDAANRLRSRRRP